jgi:putative pyruvate formate lyase activating enzyme
MIKQRKILKIHIGNLNNITINTIDRDIIPIIFDRNVVDVTSSIFKDRVKKKKLNHDQLDKIINYTENLYKECTICMRNCRVNRFKGGLGFCKNGLYGHIYSGQISYGEEKMISPTYEIYFSGCNINCSYCHQRDYKEFKEDFEYISEKCITEDIVKNSEKIKTISFVGGNPDQSLLSILLIIKELEKYNLNIPYVWNSNFLFTSKVGKILNEVIDVFLPDLKFGNDRCAKSIAGIGNYFHTVIRNILSLLPDNLLIIRHLPLRNHWDCCTRPILEWISKFAKSTAKLSLLNSMFTDNRFEIEKALDLSKRFGIKIAKT